ncbi:XRE family transcriptional regulator [Chryseobacterium sp. H3056]|uniref:XRE family transcriptional regulator n=1 Tax=Kaistella daneshvariae TaxID=2487074 RepID=A0A3N0WYM2_9FLAO|nr:helix-turn-helix transcriptional regulator [Kaistella daneshvariae]ROI10065.1 XRE family transcriptional regulator [Kaistella daneshvariae]
MGKANAAEAGVEKESELQETREKIGSALRNMREKRGLNQEQLAEKMGISRSTISKIESGKFNCSIDYLSKFAFSLDFEIILQDSHYTL